MGASKGAPILGVDINPLTSPWGHTRLGLPEVDLANFLFPDLRMDLLAVERELLEFYHVPVPSPCTALAVEWPPQHRRMEVPRGRGIFPRSYVVCPRP